MFSKLYQNLTSLVGCQPKDPIAKEYLSYLRASYPNNHNYKVKGDRLVPTRELAKRYKRVREFYPEPLTSFLDIGSCKGFFVFDASKEAECTRSLGIDVYQRDIDICRWLQERLGNKKVQFEFMRLHELADRIDEFGGPFQTVLMLNMYQYLYFGSVRNPDRYLNHDEIFKHLAKVCSHRIIFNNRIRIEDCQNVNQIDQASEHSQNYTEEKLLEAASKYFKVVQHGTFGRYPLWTMDLKATVESGSSIPELKEIFVLWTNDLSFREKFKVNAAEALMEAGFQFDADKLQKIKSMLKQHDHHVANEELDKRLNR